LGDRRAIWLIKGLCHLSPKGSFLDQIDEKTERELANPSSPGKQPLLECGPMPNVMVALPNIGGALCSMPQSLPDAHYQNALQ